MFRVVSAAAIVVAVGCSFGLYQLKHHTAIVRGEVAQLKKSVAKEQELVHILRAEWNYINRPANIRKLVIDHLPELEEVKPSQLTDVMDIPYRPLSLEDLLDEIEDGQAKSKPDELGSVSTGGGKVNG